MSYLSELRENWRFVAAASLGVSSGQLLFSYLNNNFVPHLLQEFSWSKSQFSLTGATVLLPAVCLPIAGRLIDKLGVRAIASIGVIGTPLTFVAFSAMTGNFMQYFFISAVQSIVVGSTTTSLVYSRLIAERLNLARGLALAIAACSPAAVGALTAPILADFISAHGWRAGYLAVAAFTAITGAAALLLIPRRRAEFRETGKTARRFSLQDYITILRNPTLGIIVGGLFLCNLPYMMNGLELTMILLDRSMSPYEASWMISLYAMSVVSGRLACGLALDRFPPHIVAAISLGLPGIGLCILASGAESHTLLAVAVSFLGLSLGAEADVIAYLVMRFFKVDIYSTVLGIVAAGATFSAALGALVLSLTLRLSGGFGLFLILSAVSTIAGSALFLLLGRSSIRHSVTLTPSA